MTTDARPESNDDADRVVDGGRPSFVRLAPLLDQLGELADEHLHDPVVIEIRAFDDGDWQAVAEHREGKQAGTEWAAREVLRFNPKRERFELRYLEEHAETGEVCVLIDRVLPAEPRGR